MTGVLQDGHFKSCLAYSGRTMISVHVVVGLNHTAVYRPHTCPSAERQTPPTSVSDAIPFSATTCGDYTV
jgi:hypothetical protein